MYSNYSMLRSSQNMYPYQRVMTRDGERFIGPGGILLPLLVGGLGGYAIGKNQNYGYGYPVPYQMPYPMYYGPNMNCQNCYY